MESIAFLLIEDNEGDTLLVKETLRQDRTQNEVSVIKNGWKAVQFLEKKGAYGNTVMPDFIFLGTNLSKLSGHEVLAKIKSNPQIQHTTKIMLTTSSPECDILKNHTNSPTTKSAEARIFLEAIATIEEFWTSIVQLPKN